MLLWLSANWGTVLVAVLLAAVIIIALAIYLLVRPYREATKLAAEVAVK